MDETKNRRTMSQFQKFSYETNKRLRDKYVNIQKYELGEEKRRQNVLENRRSKMRKMMDYLRRKSFSSYNECNNPNSRDKSSCSPKNMKSMNSLTVSKQDASEEFRVASNLVQLSELHSEVHEESITSPTSSHTPRKPLKFVISPQPNERESTSNRLPTSSGSVLKIAEDPVTPVTNISACSTQVHSNQVRSTEVRKSSDENPPNSSGTDDEISSITLDISNPVCQFASCEYTREDNDSIIFPEDSETSQTDENIPHFEIGSTPKYTRSILKSRSISPRTYLDSTYECFQDEFADTLYRLRDSVELATDRFQIGYVPSHYGGSSCTSEYVLQSCSTSHESEIIESPRTPRKTVRFADETTDFAQSCPTSVNPIFSNVFPLKIASDIDVIPSAVRSDTLTPTQPSLEKIAENNPVHSYGSLSSMSSNFISISIGFTSAQSLKPFNTNPVSMHNLDIVNSNSEISENPNPKISLKTECTTEHSIKEKKEQTLEYERLKSHNQRTASSFRKSQSKTNVNSRRISKSQGYADLLIGRPNLHKDFLIPRQQLLSYRTSLSPLFSHQMSGYQSITSSKLSCQDSNHPDAEGNSSNGGLPCSLNALLSDIAAPLEVNQNCFRVHNPCSTNSFENQRIYDTMKDIDIHVKAQCQNAPASTYTHNDNERKFYRDVDPPDYEGINVSFIRNEMPGKENITSYLEASV
ncbi:unnamed protein product [Heterobilharzia americana]|nr:unnamed protein product [Heterobilharzia americana]